MSLKVPFHDRSGPVVLGGGGTASSPLYSRPYQRGTSGSGIMAMIPTMQWKGGGELGVGGDTAMAHPHIFRRKGLHDLLVVGIAA